MPFQKGRAKTGGRVKGGNKATREVLTLLHAMNHNPVENLILIAQDKKNRIEVRARAEMFLIDKYIPSLKAIELSGPGGAAIEHNVNVSPRQRILAGIARVRERRSDSGSSQRSA